MKTNLLGKLSVLVLLIGIPIVMMGLCGYFFCLSMSLV